MGTADRVAGLVAPALEAERVDLYDVEHAGGVLRVLIDRAGGVDLDTIAAVTRAVSRLLDEHDPVAGRYTLEVSSPGLERPLRTPAHFAGAIGSTVTVRTRPEVEGERRVDGVLEAADADGVTVAGRVLRYDDIERAKTVFEWGPAARKGPKK